MVTAVSLHEPATEEAGQYLPEGGLELRLGYIEEEGLELVSGDSSNIAY